MHVHRALHDRAGCLRVHEVSDCMNDLVAFDAEHRGAQEAFAFGVNEHFHQTLRFSAFACASDAAHRHCRDQRLATRLPHLSLFAFVEDLLDAETLLHRVTLIPDVYVECGEPA